ncbi:hypothetical protein GOBAR_DD23651 [Gossypium barbadense]|nr:hypothetical protein GOBAR_DD23651 [Gossypium barbadense]
MDIPLKRGGGHKIAFIEMALFERGKIREERQMVAFREVLKDCEMSGLGFFGKWYTWERGRLARNNIKERLDKGVANPEWWDLFTGQCQFHFNSNWILAKGFEERVKHGWNLNEQDILVKLKEMGVRLSNWAKKEKGLRERRTRDLNSRLLELSVAISPCITEELKEELMVEFKVEEVVEAMKTIAPLKASGIIAQNKEGLVMASCTYPWENISDLIMAYARAYL